MTSTLESIQDPIFDKKLHQVSADLKQYRINQLKRMEQTNSTLLVEYLYSRMREGNLKPASRANTIDRLSRLSIFYKNKSFRDMTTEDIFTYLDSLRRTESDDPMHRWIGTYNLSVIKIISFFKWLYEPDTHSINRQIPTFLNSVKCLKRKEKTTCCARDLWTNEEDLLFLKYCPDKRLRLYHIMARETSGRPHELLSLKIGDVIFHNTDEGKVYATVTIGNEGKTISRTLPIINSIPYLKDWLTSDHPHGDSKNHFLFPSLNRKSIMSNCQEPNKPETKFCAKCRMVLSYDAYTQVIEENESEKQSEIAQLRDQVNQNTESNRILYSTFKDVLDLLRLKSDNDNTGSDIEEILSIKDRLKQKGIRITGATTSSMND